jgi:hypothetical protein
MMLVVVVVVVMMVVMMMMMMMMPRLLLLLKESRSFEEAWIGSHQQISSWLVSVAIVAIASRKSYIACDRLVWYCMFRVR